MEAKEQGIEKDKGKGKRVAEFGDKEDGDTKSCEEDRLEEERFKRERLEEGEQEEEEDDGFDAAEMKAAVIVSKELDQEAGPASYISIQKDLDVLIQIDITDLSPLSRDNWWHDINDIDFLSPLPNQHGILLCSPKIHRVQDSPGFKMQSAASSRTSITEGKNQENPVLLSLSPVAATVMARQAEDFDEDLFQPSSPKPVLVKMVLQSQHHSSPVCYGDLLEDAVDGNDFRDSQEFI